MITNVRASGDIIFGKVGDVIFSTDKLKNQKKVAIAFKKAGPSRWDMITNVDKSRLLEAYGIAMRLFH